MNNMSHGGMILAGENRRTCPNATLSITNPTLTDPDANPDLRSERKANLMQIIGISDVIQITSGNKCMQVLEVGTDGTE
jgi:hypothetical protein